MLLGKWQISECEKLEGRKWSFDIEDEHCLGLGMAWWGSEHIPPFLGVHPSLLLWVPADGHPEQVSSSPLESVPQEGAWSRKSFSTHKFRFPFSFRCPHTAVAHVSEVAINVTGSTRDLFWGSGWFCCLKFLPIRKICILNKISGIF